MMEDKTIVAKNVVSSLVLSSCPIFGHIKDETILAEKGDEKMVDKETEMKVGVNAAPTTRWKPRGFLMRVFMSKKVIVSLVGMILAILTAAGVVVPAGTEDALITAVVAIVGAFNVGQGLADGISRGRTSAGRDIYD